MKIRKKFKKRMGYRVKTTINRTAGPMIPKTKRKDKHITNLLKEWYNEEEG
ncbi:MAG: hypothetical protein N3A54_01760 [Patescibacteria group bacterium]|nr:hypothetical protein [Patescibacteria group bacterium]